MMKATIMPLLITLFCLTLSDGAWSQAPLEINHKRDIRFGEWAAVPTNTGFVTIPPTSDTASASGGLISFGGRIRRARFQVVGEPRAWVNITLPSSITIRRGTSGNIMTVDSFTMDKTNPVRLSRKGKVTINIGARLRVGSDQRQGNYNDDNAFFVYADYQ